MQKNFSSTVAVVGLGRVGLSLAVQCAMQQRRVIGCDSNLYVVESVRRGQAHIFEEHELAAEAISLVHKGLLTTMIDTTEAVRQAGVVIVLVPVIVDEMHEANFQDIDAVTVAIGAGLQPGTLVMYETALPVGTTATRFVPLLEQHSRLTVGRDFYLTYSPEHVAYGRSFRELHTYPKVVGGVDAKSTAVASAFYRSVLDVETITMSSTNEAEFVQLIETTYRDVNIALANEYARFADIHRLDVSVATAAANTQPYLHITMPGVGVDKHYAPIYPHFLRNDLRSSEQYQHITTSLPPLTLPRVARRINDSMAEYAISRIEAVVGSLAQQSVLLLGVAYQGDVCESTFTNARLLQDALRARGAIVYVDDQRFGANELHTLGYTPLSEGNKSEICAVILRVAHPAYTSLDFSVFSYCRVVLDERRALQRKYIESLGMTYIAIGDSHAELQQPKKIFALSASTYSSGSKSDAHDT